MLIEKRRSYLDLLEEFWKSEPCRRKIGRFEKLKYEIPDEIAHSIYLLQLEVKLRDRFYKECPRGYEVDHIIPRTKGGSDTLENLQWIPKKINQWKGRKIISDESEYPHCIINIEEKINKKSLEEKINLNDKFYALEKIIGDDELALNEFLLYFSEEKIRKIRKKIANKNFKNANDSESTIKKSNEKADNDS